jgi:hypothetical protein
MSQARVRQGDRGPSVAWLVGGAILFHATTSSAAIRPEDAAAHAGSLVTVEGYVERAVCSSKACVLSFGPAFSGLVVSIPEEAGVDLGTVQEQYEGRTVRVKGVVTTPQGRPRIEIEDASGIERVDLAVGVKASRLTDKKGDAPSGSSAPPAAAGPAAAGPGAGMTTAAAGSGWKVSVQAEPDGGQSVADIARALEASEEGGRPRVPAAGAVPGELDSRVRALEERMGESAALPPGQLPLTDGPVFSSQPDDVAGLNEQLATVDAHLVELAQAIALLEERVAALETYAASTSGANQEAAPVVARAGSLHRARRGWSADRVLRTFGQPERVIPTGGGTATWHYSGGRSLTIDPRGRVTAAIGF